MRIQRSLVVRASTRSWSRQGLLYHIHHFMHSSTNVTLTSAPSASPVMSRRELSRESQRNFPQHQSSSKVNKWQPHKVILPLAIYLKLDIPSPESLGTSIRAHVLRKTNTQPLNCINKGCKNSRVTELTANFAIQQHPPPHPSSTKVHLVHASWLVCCHDNRALVNRKLDFSLNVTTSS